MESSISSTVRYAEELLRCHENLIFDFFFTNRNRVPWAIIVACNGAVAILALLIRAYLASQNAARDRMNEGSAEKNAGTADFDDQYIVVRDDEGREVKKRVDRAFLDLTDLQNQEFRYVL